MQPDVLYLDNHLFVVNKPPGVLVQADRTGDLDLLTAGKDWLKAHFNKPGNVYLGLVHRLDRPASGVIVFGRTSKSASRLSDQFRRRLPVKHYVTIVEGFLKGNGKLDDHLIKEGERVHIVTPDTPGAKRATLTYDVIAGGEGFSLVRVRLQTGRSHQIRIQFANLGHPIMGDFRYGAQTTLDGRNLALHCYHLAVEHPTRREWMSWTASPPPSWGEHFRDAIRILLEG